MCVGVCRCVGGCVGRVGVWVRGCVGAVVKRFEKMHFCLG